MGIYLIRHTTPNIETGICYGQSDLDLAQTYNAEFELLLKKLSNIKNPRVYSSPLKRCSLLAKRINPSLILDERLKELNFGDWELKPWNIIPDKEIGPWMKDFVNITVPNGESYVQLSTRVMSFFKDIASTESNQNLIIITHAGPIRALLANTAGIALEDSFKIKINYGDIFQLSLKKDTLSLVTEINL